MLGVLHTKQPIVRFLLVNPCSGLLGDHRSFVIVNKCQIHPHTLRRLSLVT